MIIDPDKQSFGENHKLMIGSIVPRPIAFVSTVSINGKKNLAPFSYFNGVCSNPPTVMFAPGRRGHDGLTKDTLNNIRETEQFVINIVSEEIGDGGPGTGFVVIGAILIFHIDDDVYNKGRIDIEALKPIGRLAGNSYSHIRDTFDIVRKVRPD